MVTFVCLPDHLKAEISKSNGRILIKFSSQFLILFLFTIFTLEWVQFRISHFSFNFAEQNCAECLLGNLKTLAICVK